MVRTAIALGAVLLSGAAFAAPESLSKVDTDKGEVLLEVQATGVAVSKIVNASTACDLRVWGKDKTDAQKKMKQKQADMRVVFAK